MERPIVFTGIKPTGRLTLGNYFGALRRMADIQHEADQPQCLFAVVDLHALTVDHDPARLRSLTQEVATLSLAAGLDPASALVFRQSDVPAHTQLAYLLECTGYVGELNRMIQFREKGRGRPKTRVSLYTYPLLMAADILAYRTTHVPVGDDQRQHLELTRDIAARFNREYGEVFVVPEPLEVEVAARVMDLQDPTSKMKGSAPDDAPGVIRLLDPLDVIRRKVLRAVTDSGSEVRYDPTAKPGVSNLVELLAAATGRGVNEVAAAYTSYGALKRDTADAVIALLEPLQKGYAELAADPSTVDDALASGAEHAADLAAPTVAAAQEAIGLRG